VYSLSEKSGYNEGMADAMNKSGIVYKDIGDYKKAIECLEKAKTLYEKCGDKGGCAMVCTNMRNTYMNMGNYPQALKMHLESVKHNETIHDTTRMGYGMINIGNIYDRMKNPDLASENYEKALEYFLQTNCDDGMAMAYSNLGSLFQDKKDYEKALDYYQKALDIDKKNERKKSMSIDLNNLGGVYMELQMYALAEKTFMEALSIKKEIGDRKGASITLDNLGMLETQIGRHNEAKKYFEEALAIALEIGNPERIYEIYKNLAGNSFARSSYREAYEYYDKFFTVYDSVLTVENSQAIAEMQTLYETEKKEKEIDLLNKDKKLKELEIAKKDKEAENQRIVVISLIGGLLLIIALSLLIYNRYSIKKKANLLLAKQNVEILQKNEEIMTQRDEIEAQRNLLYEQKETIEEIHHELTSSIHYARRIQRALLPSLKILEQTGFQTTVFYQPRDIVSGDYYWARQVNDWLLFCVADCTGHGVPGAFMSMLGITYLNEIVRGSANNTAGKVLDSLREHIVEALGQDREGEPDKVKDGMDMAFCALNLSTLELQFAGANNSLFIARKKPADPAVPLEEIAGDRMPVAIHERMDPFSTNTTTLEKGDIIFILSDGFYDQFGGPEGKKFKTRNLKNTLLLAADTPFEEREIRIRTVLENWRRAGKEGSFLYEQTDDITVLAMEI
jgi:tetratricopeptide (TPR) repeat protein